MRLSTAAIDGMRIAEDSKAEVECRSQVKSTAYLTGKTISAQIYRTIRRQLANG